MSEQVKELLLRRNGAKSQEDVEKCISILLESKNESKEVKSDNIERGAELKMRTCNLCGKGGCDKACSVCKKVYYCSKKCQKKDLEKHKGECQKS